MAINDDKLAYLKANTTNPLGAYDDIEQQFLKQKTSLSLSLPDMWYAFLKAQGFSYNSLDENLLAFWDTLGIGQLTRPQGGVTYYVSAAGDNSKDGKTPATAWLTSAKVAAQTFAPGTKVLFRGGDTFSGFAVPAPSAVMTGQAPVVYGSYGTGLATINGAYDAGSGAVIYGHNISNVSITNLNVTGGGKAGVYFSSDDSTTHTGISILFVNQSGQTDATNAGLLLGGDAGESGISAVVSYCTVHNNAGGGIGVYQSGTTKPMRITVSYCVAYSNATQGGIVLGGVTGGLVDHCVTYANGASSTAGPVGCWLYDSNNTIIQYSESYGNLSANSTDGGGFDIDGGCANCVMQFNYSHDNVGAGFLVYAYSGSTNAGSIVCFNISSNDGSNSGYGALVAGSVDANTTTGMQIYNNTFICNKASRASVVITAGTPAGKITNNIIYSTVRYVDSGATNPPSLLFQGNCYFGGGNINWNSVAYSTVALWQAAQTTQEKVSGSNVAVTTDPKLVDPTGHPTVGGYLPSALSVFRPQSGSSVFAAGINLLSVLSIANPTIDYYGSVPTNNYDIGAAFQTSSA